MSVLELVNEMSSTYETLPTSITAQFTSIIELISLTSSVLKSGGRIFILGAGTSGRLAAECSSYSPNQILAIPAGGNKAIFSSQKGAEDQYTSAWSALEKFQLEDKDIVIGLSASGRSPFVVGGLCIAQEQGIRTASIACNARAKMSEFADVAVEIPVGPELIVGSTRMKSGSVQMFVLSLIAQTNLETNIVNVDYLQSLLLELEQQNLPLQFSNPAMIDLIKMGACSLKSGGRVVYVGNEACGRLGVIDASECPPTFGVDKTRVSGLIPNGDPVFKSAFGALSNLSLIEQIHDLKLDEKDTIILINSSLHPALDFEQIKQSCTASKTKVSVINIVEVEANASDDEPVEEGVTLKLQIQKSSNHEIIFKMVIKQTLNMFSTAAMIQDGRIIGNRMAFMQRTNLKLCYREIQNLQSLSGLRAHQCAVLLSFFESSAQANQEYISAKVSVRQSF